MDDRDPGTGMGLELFARARNRAAGTHDTKPHEGGAWRETVPCNHSLGTWAHATKRLRDRTPPARIALGGPLLPPLWLEPRALDATEEL